MNASREEALFALILEIPAESRTAFLDATCQEDASLRQRLAARLAVRSPEPELDTPTEVGQSPIKVEFSQKPPDEAVGLTVDRYKLREKIGEGGCGVVYVAEQTEPVRRRVALKVIKLGMDTKQVVARFEAERQALAMMDHPNIAKVLDAGTTETGRPYFVMELVRGCRITDHCDQAKLSATDRLDLFVKVCQAIQHAHQKGIIHRDIKPSNVLVTMHDGVAVPKVIDFGIAKATAGKLTDETVYTQLHQFIGTPAYMSPEQAEMSGLDIDTRSDIYSLGVLLYELLTGKTPFDAHELVASGVDAMRKTIREKEPSRPSTRLATLQNEDLTTTAQRRSIDTSGLAHLLKGDLDWIVMKCLEKDRTRRYETSNALAADVTRHLSNEPVTARPASPLYKFQKAIRRNRLAFTAAGAIAVALVVGIVVSTWQATVATRARKAAELQRLRADDFALRATTNASLARAEAAKSAQVVNFLTNMLASVGPSVSPTRDTSLLREIFEKAASKLDSITNQPEVEADIRVIIGRTSRDLSDYAMSARMNRRALELRRITYGERHEAVAQALNELAKSLHQQGNWAEAEPIQREALSIRQEQPNADDLIIADMYNDLGIILWKLGKLREAREAYRSSLAIKEKKLISPNEKLADAHLNLSLVLLDLTDYSGGEAEAQAALVEYQKIFLKGHPKVGWAQHNRAKMLREAGQLDEAELAIKSAIETYAKVYSGDHGDWAEALDDYGQILQKKQDFVGSEAKFREALAMARRRLEEGHPQTLSTMRHLALLKAREPFDPEAEAMIQEATTFSRKRFATQPARLAACLEDLGTYMIRTGRPGEALPVLQEAYHATVEGGRPAVDRRRAATQLSELYLKLDQPEEADKWSAKAAQISND